MRIIFIIFLFPLLVTGQWQINSFVGIGVSNVNGNLTKEQGVSYKFNSGFQYGMALSRFLKKNLEVQVEIKKSEMGYVKHVQPEIWDLNIHYDYDYLNISILGKYSLGNKSVRGLMLAGPRFGMAPGKISLKSNVENSSHLISFEDAGFNSKDFGIEFGSGLQFKFGSICLDLEMRYYIGFLNIQKIPSGSSLYNKSSYFNLGITLPIL